MMNAGAPMVVQSKARIAAGATISAAKGHRNRVDPALIQELDRREGDRLLDSALMACRQCIDGLDSGAGQILPESSKRCCGARRERQKPKGFLPQCKSLG
ncbi:hypothetical protein ES332_A13G088900v1 [Gossypium tomentosum]|uniref:Uncharacterized protein n=1 Tax=Gossypium tomentosum TaxID=34277 RepID=A0A5D2MI11_GOSTO|nr:hypothetical protein ES332_A13G088900v1 [Gossypium tomentosum]